MWYSFYMGCNQDFRLMRTHCWIWNKFMLLASNNIGMWSFPTEQCFFWNNTDMWVILSSAGTQIETVTRIWNTSNWCTCVGVNKCDEKETVTTSEQMWWGRNYNKDLGTHWIDLHVVGWINVMRSINSDANDFLGFDGTLMNSYIHKHVFLTGTYCRFLHSKSNYFIIGVRL
jgi:hypothetical protein